MRDIYIQLTRYKPAQRCPNAGSQRKERNLRWILIYSSRIFTLLYIVSSPSRSATNSEAKPEESDQRRCWSGPRKRKHRRSKIRSHVQLSYRSIDDVTVDNKHDLSNKRGGENEQKCQEGYESRDHRAEVCKQGSQSDQEGNEREDDADNIHGKHPLSGSM